MKNYLSCYQSVKAAIWQGRVDGFEPDQQRWHQRILLVDLSQDDLPELAEGLNGFAFIGFCCDEGVKRNEGRTGSKEGPDALRKACASFPVHFDAHVVLLDTGNIVCEQGDLETAQAALAELVFDVLSSGYMPIIFGGGHEVVCGHYHGVAPFYSAIGIISFDAHFDLRALSAEGATSGTGFWQIAQDCEAQKKPFYYMPVGIQQHANTLQLYKTAAGLGVNTIAAEDFHAGNAAQLLTVFQDFMGKADAICLTIDMDVFASAYSPGVSAPAAVGIIPDAFFLGILQTVLKNRKLISLDIAELNPLFDIDNRTAKLGAWLIYQCIKNSIT